MLKVVDEHSALTLTMVLPTRSRKTVMNRVNIIANNGKMQPTSMQEETMSNYFCVMKETAEGMKRGQPTKPKKKESYTNII